MLGSHRMSLRERAALWISATIVLVTIGYWITQIVGVAHMLKLAYG